jgi:serine/threonine-protein kinase RsbW
VTDDGSETAAPARDSELALLDRAIAGASSSEELQAEGLTHVLRLSGAVAGAIGLLARDGTLTFSHQRGFTEQVERWRRVGVDADTAAGAAAREGSPVWLTDGREADERFPKMASIRAPYEARAALPLGGASGTLGVLYLAWDHPIAFQRRQRRPLTELAARLGRALDRVLLLEAATRSERRTRALQRVTADLGADRSSEEIARIAAAGARDAVAAEAGGVVLVEEGRLILRAVEGFVSDDEPGDEITDATGLLRGVVEHDRIVTFASKEEMIALAPDRAEEIAALPFEAAAFLPIPGTAGVLGVLNATRATRAFDEDELDVLVAIARQSGQAVERARHLEGRERALERERALHRVTQALARDRTVPQMAESVLDGIELFDAPKILVAGVDTTGGQIVPLAHRGFPGDDDIDAYARLPLDGDAPLAEAARTGDRVELSSRDDVVVRFPARLPILERLGIEATVVQPVAIEGRPVAVIALSFERPRRIDEEERALLDTLATLLGGALERAEAYQAEIDARANLERAMSRLGRLQSVTASLTPQLRTDEIAATILRQVRSAFDADGAGLFVPDGEGGLEALGLLGGGHGWDGADDVREDSPLAIADAFRSGHPVWVPSQAEWRRRYPMAPPDYHRGAGAVFAIPLVVEDERRGVLGLLFRREHALGRDERRLATTIGQQAAQALERARLYDSERRLARRNARFQEVAASLAAAATPVAIGEVLAGPGARAVDAVSCLVGVLEPDGQAVRLLGGHAGRDEAVPLEPDSPWPGVASIATRGQVVVADPAARARYPAVTDGGGEGAWIALPLLTGTGAIGFVQFGFADEAAIAAASIDSLRTMAAQAAQAMDRARLFAMEHEVALVLQESLLPPSQTASPTFEVATRYQPGAEHLEVGGDWFEVVHLDGDRLAIAVGDVVGRGLNAAAAMGQLRSAVRALALQNLGPIGVLDALEAFAGRTPGTEMSTVVYGELDPDTGEFRFASAGHLPPLLESDESVEVLEGGRSPLLTVPADGPRPDHVVRIPPGATLVLYTDGLVERRGEVIDRGIQRLSRALRATATEEPEARIDELLDRMLGGVERDDDVAIVCVRRAPDAERRFRAWVPPEPSALAGLRHRLDAWLRLRCLSDDDVDAVVLAVNEAVANAIEHGRAERARVVVEAEIDELVLRATVRDRGRWLDRPSDPDRGRGLLLMEALMDEVAVDRSPEGTTLTLRRRVTERQPS